jgi:hypothetical protein
MAEFPSSVSCVSEICVEEDDSISITPILNTIPTLFSVVQTAAPDFEHRFPCFRPSYPVFLSRTEIHELFLITFVYMEKESPRSASMVFQATRGTFPPYRWAVTFNPWHSKPQGQKTFDWIYLYYVLFEPALYTLERLFTDFYNSSHAEFKPALQNSSLDEQN